ncbi:MAG: Mov34/MPN/PAD-1 family protein [Methanobacteriota archaeon]
MSPKPRIVGHEEAKVADSPPPKPALSHPWSIEPCRPRKGEPCALYLSSLAEEALRKHAVAHKGERLEVMGLLLGEMRRDLGLEYALARKAVTTQLDATLVGVRFSREGLDELAASLAKVDFEYVVIGWYHSHPGFGCFLSETDVATQRAMFSGAGHVALVVDPVKEEAGAFRLDSGGYVPARFGIYIE